MKPETQGFIPERCRNGSLKTSRTEKGGHPVDSGPDLSGDNPRIHRGARAAGKARRNAALGISDVSTP